MNYCQKLWKKELKKLESEVALLKQRNKTVEMGKAWEVSTTRRLILVVFTYIAIMLYMYAVDIDRPWLNAIVPAVGFVLSTLTMPYFKNIWIKFRK